MIKPYEVTCKEVMLQHHELLMLKVSSYNWKSVRGFYAHVAKQVELCHLEFNDATEIRDAATIFFKHSDLQTSTISAGGIKHNSPRCNYIHLVQLLLCINYYHQYFGGVLIPVHMKYGQIDQLIIIIIIIIIIKDYNYYYYYYYQLINLPSSTLVRTDSVICLNNALVCYVYKKETRFC